MSIIKKIAKFSLLILALLIAFIILDAFYLWNWGLNKDTKTSIKLPTPTGLYKVGRALFDWTDSNRNDPFENTKKRELMVWVWYPVTSLNKCKPAEYLPGKWGESAAKWHAFDLHMKMNEGQASVFIPHPPLSAISIQQIKTFSYENVLMDSATSFPVLFFSPGLGMMPTDYTAIIENIASHGYIVVGVNPTHFVATTYFSNGTSVGGIPLLNRLENLEDFMPVWVNDLLFSLKKIKELNLFDTSILFHHVNINEVGIFGHSYGGAAAAVASFKDSTFKAGINMDGSPRGDTLQWKLRQPFLILQSDQGLHTDQRSRLFYHGLKNGRLIVIKNSRHRAFSDESVYPLPNPGRENLLGKIEGRKMVATTSHFIIAFFDIYLKHHPSYAVDSLR